MNPRATFADLLKGIAVLLMIQVHIVELFASPKIVESTAGEFLLFLGGPFVAPIFMIVFGYFIASSKKSTSSLIQRGISIFLVGILLNIALNINLLIHIYQGIFELNPLTYIFGVDILHFAGISLLIIALLRKILRRNMWFPIGFAVLFAFLAPFLQTFKTDNSIAMYVLSFFYGNSDWSYFPVFPWMAYPLIGMAVFQGKKHFSEIKILQKTSSQFVLGLCFAAFLIFTLNYGISIASNLPEYYHHGIIFFIWNVVFLLFYAFYLNQLNKKIENTIVVKYLYWLGKNVTAIYIIQWIIIGNTATEIYKTVDSPFVLLISFTGVLISSSLLTLGCYLKLKN